MKRLVMKIPSICTACARQTVPRMVLAFAALIWAAICYPPGLHAANQMTPAAGLHSRFAALRIGEVLNYQVDWRGFTGAAVAQLRIVNRGKFYGRESWHFRAALHTAEPFRALYSLDDVIDAYPLAANLAGRELQEHFVEFGKPEDDFVSITAPPGSSRAPLPHVIVPAGTMDALSAIYFLRLTNWSNTPEIHAPVFDGENIYEMRARKEESRVVNASARKYPASEISIQLFQAGKDTGERFTLWLADNRARTPVLCTAELPIGTVRIELTSGSGMGPDGEITPEGDSNHRAGN